MKKFLPFAAFALFAATMSFSFASCGSDDDEDSKFKNEEFKVGDVSFAMVAVEGGNFMMGAPETDSEAMTREKPQHKVTLSNFYIGETVVTQALWKAVMGSNHSYPQGMLLPANVVSWDDCQMFIVKLNKLTGNKFRLPTEAEWEYAARGGKKSKGFKYAGSDNLDEVAWYVDNAPAMCGNGARTCMPRTIISIAQQRILAIRHPVRNAYCAAVTGYRKRRPVVLRFAPMRKLISRVRRMAYASPWICRPMEWSCRA